MLNGSLGENTTGKHHIYLKLDSRPAFQSPHFAWLEARKRGGQGTAQMLKEVVANPATLEWAELVLSALKRKKCVFVWTKERKSQ